jgi:hypothetical protein
MIVKSSMAATLLFAKRLDPDCRVRRPGFGTTGRCALASGATMINEALRSAVRWTKGCHAGLRFLRTAW